MGKIEGLYGACSEIEVALDCLFRKQGYRPAYADDALAKIRAGIGDGIFSIRPEPRQTADPLVTGAQWNQALDVVRNREAASSESIEAWRNDPLVHRLASMLEQWEREIDRRVRDEQRQTSGEVEVLQHLDAIIGLCDGTRGPEDLDSDPFETIGRHAEKARAILARKGE